MLSIYQKVTGIYVNIIFPCECLCSVSIAPTFPQTLVYSKNPDYTYIARIYKYSYSHEI